MKATEITSPTEIKEYVEQRGNVASIRMEIIRDAFGHDRLGVHVRAKIARDLAGMGLGTYPAGENIPDNRNHDVRVYKLGSTAAQVIQSVLTVGRDGDEIIRRALSKECEDKLEKIRELIEA